MAKLMKVLLLTPPARPPGEPYPATAYLAGFLRTQDIDVAQQDVGLDLLLKLLSKTGLARIAEYLDAAATPGNGSIPVADKYLAEFMASPDPHIHSIDGVIRFAQGKDRPFAHHILKGQAPFDGVFASTPNEVLRVLYGVLSTQDKAGHIVGHYLANLMSSVLAKVDNVYDVGMAAKYGGYHFPFDDVLRDLAQPRTLVDDMLSELICEYLERHDPSVVGITIPFPSEVIGAFKVARLVREHSDAAIVIGGGYVNAHLRAVKIPELFELVDYITLDNGEIPLLKIVEHLSGTRSKEELCRTHILDDGAVRFVGGSQIEDIKNVHTKTPDFSEFALGDYLPCLYAINSPIQKLNADGPWLGIFMAHGCYWARCEFCTIKLPMIKDYAPLTANDIVDTVETLIDQTGITGFYFTDSAMPPAAIQTFCELVLERNLKISWFGNMKSGPEFTPELISLMRDAGCVWLMSGVETFNNRHLRLIKKGTSNKRLIRFMHQLSVAGIRFHGYLIVGLPTQTLQEAIDDLEVTRQLFQRGYIHNVQLSQFQLVPFSGYDTSGEDPQGRAAAPGHTELCEFLDQLPAVNTAMNRAMTFFALGRHLDKDLQYWFDFPVPATTIPSTYVDSIVEGRRLNSASIANNAPASRPSALRVID